MGVKAAIELAGGAGEPPVEPVPVQAPLFPAAELGALPEGRTARQAVLRGPRGPGRPAGARNKATLEWRDYLLQRYGSALIGLAEIAARSPADLALELGCKPLEAFDRQLKALIELAPYEHGKMPVEVKISSTVPLLILGDPSEILGEQGLVLDHEALPDLAQLQPVENQGVSDQPAGEVGQPGLDSAANMQADQADSSDRTLISDQAQPAPAKEEK